MVRLQFICPKLKEIPERIPSETVVLLTQSWELIFLNKSTSAAKISDQLHYDKMKITSTNQTV